MFGPSQTGRLYLLPPLRLVIRGFYICHPSGARNWEIAGAGLESTGRILIEDLSRGGPSSWRTIAAVKALTS